MKITSFDDFLTYFDLSYFPLIEDYMKNLIVWRSQSQRMVSEYLKDKNDIRTRNYYGLIEAYYEMFYENRMDTLKYWYDKHIAIKDPEKYLYFNLKKDILKEDVISGSYHSGLNRIIKNLNFDSLYKTKKTNGLDSTEILPALKMMFESPTIYYPLLLPMSAEKVLDRNLDDIFAILRGTTNRPSVFNPYTAAYIFTSILKSKKIFTPVLDWGSYYIAFENTPNAYFYVGSDVMKSQLNTILDIKEWYENNGGFFPKRKTSMFFKLQSETLEESGFTKEWAGYFDTVFLSPPYYDLELYHQGTKDKEQSTSKFKTYNDWLRGYWSETCRQSRLVMEDGGKFAFVITDKYGIGDNKFLIGPDMLTIAKEHFDLVDTYKIEWSSITRVSAEKMKEGNYEHLFVMRPK